MKLLDSSVWLAHLAEANKRAVSIMESNEILFCSILTLFEVRKKLIKIDVETDKIEESMDFLKNRAIIINLNEEIINNAVNISVNDKLSAIDSLVYASARSISAEFITGDNDFRNLENVEII